MEAGQALADGLLSYKSWLAWTGWAKKPVSMLYDTLLNHRKS